MRLQNEYFYGEYRVIICLFFVFSPQTFGFYETKITLVSIIWEEGN